MLIQGALLFLELHCCLSYLWRHLLKQEFDDFISLFLEEDLEILSDHLSGRIALDADRQDVLFDLRHRGLSHYFLVLLAEHALYLLL